MSEKKSNQNVILKKCNCFIERINKISGIYLLIGLIFIIVLFVFKDFLIFKKIYLFLDIGSDSYNMYYPDFIHSMRYLKTDGIPAWSFFQGMGQNVFPGGLNNPFNLILYLFGEDLLGYGIVYVEILKIVIIGILFFLFLKLLQFSRHTCIIGGLLVSFLGYTILGSSGWYGHSTNVVYFIFFLYSFELYYVKKKWFLFPIAVFLIVANPFRLYLYVVFLFIYALLRIIADKNFTPKDTIVFFMKLAGIGTIGLGISAVFTSCTLFEMINSPRVAGDVKAVDQLTSTPIFAFPKKLQAVTALLRLFSNDLMGTGSNFKGWCNYLEAPVFYSGLLSLLMLPQAFLQSDRRKKIVLGIFLLLWILPIIFLYFRFALYLFVGNYYKTGLSLFFSIVLVMLGLRGLENFQKSNNRNYIVLLITFVILFIILFFPFFKSTQSIDKNMINNSVRVSLCCFLLFYAGILYFMRFDKFVRYAKYLLLILICVELGYLSSITVNKRVTLTKKQFTSRIGYNDYTIDAIRYLKSIDKGFYRVNKNYSSSLAQYKGINDAKVQGFYGTPSYSSFNKREYIEFLKEMGIIKKGEERETRWAIGLLGRPLLQAVAGVKYNLSKQKIIPAFSAVYESIARFEDVTVLKNVMALPLGFTYDKYIQLNDFRTLSGLNKDIAMFNAFVTDTIYPECNNLELYRISDTAKKLTWVELAKIVEQRRHGAMEITHFSQNNIRGKVNLEKKKLLFFSIPFDSGWKAFDNGKPVDVKKVNVGFMGLILDKGQHNIELKYSIKYFKIGLLFTCISLLIYILMIFLNIYRIKRIKVKV